MQINNYSPKGKNPNCTKVIDNKGIRFFSYNTVIAFKGDGDTVLISDKKWSVTTARHRSHIKAYVSDYQEIEHTEFLRLYKETFGENHKDNY